MPVQGILPNRVAAYVATSRQVACVVGDEAVILQLDDGIYYSLNVVGARVWSLLQEPQTTDALVACLLTEFEVSAEACRADVEELLTALQSRALVVPAEASG